MGALGTCGYVIGGGRTPFDAVIGEIEDAEAMLREADIPAEFHTGGTDETVSALFGGEAVVEPHICDPKAERLARAREGVEEAWYAVLAAWEAG